MSATPLAAGTLPAGLLWDADRGRLKVRDPRLAEIVLRDQHIITGVDHGKSGRVGELPPPGVAPTITQFFEMWYTVGEHYAVFNSELRKVFIPRAVQAFGAAFRAEADRLVAGMPARGDLARDYLSPYLTHSTFLMLGVPGQEWGRLAKVSRLVIHLFKQQLLGVTEYGEREQTAFATTMLYLKRLTDELLAGPGTQPFLTAARQLATVDSSNWPIAALIGQLLMAGIEPMIVGSSIACREIWSSPHLRESIQRELVDTGEIAEEMLRQNPPFGNIFRFVSQPCDCLGVQLPPGTIVAVDTAAVNLSHHPAADPARGCPVRPSELLTFGKGTHYCLGAHSARLQIATGLRQLVHGAPGLEVDVAAVRIDTSNNLKEVRTIPYRIGSDDVG
ncbi:cytochrome P450 [Solwaraspora sp. WMMA2065]|uniref:cytochrome P450 n=1 Tax=Solwaraspora sp. WMMA2065 TaxID=3015166 RepID=UPI00259B7595|nr:cytochrome P450 [Solwaraspora sp. WMMA2065]WJK33698.1 cytochrome P450 [Solwaraspora sp. WMMA2065]